jgi:predicted RNA-binding protein associated with RNAse of E/G family
MDRDSAITVHKLDAAGTPVWSYPGVVIERAPGFVVVEARFRPARVDLGYVVFERGDRFVEWFFADRWYNVFEAHSFRDDRLKGWYCNMTRPAVIRDHEVSSEDLELDVWVDPARQISLLDQEEYEALRLEETERREVAAAVAEIRRLVEGKMGPFGAGAAR